MPEEPVSRPRPRLLRFSVRGLIVVVLAIGAVLGWVVRSAQIQRDAVAAIEKAGGHVVYESFWYGRSAPPKQTGVPTFPGWLGKFVSIDYLAHVTAVTLNSSPRVTDDTLEQIGALSRFIANLTSLDLGDTQLNETGLAHLKWHKNISWLDLRNTNVTDPGLVNLKGLSHLVYLDLSQTPVTDAGLAHLEGLHNLFNLRLELTQVTDLCVPHLKVLPRLSALSIGSTHFSDDGEKTLKEVLPQLKFHH